MGLKAGAARVCITPPLGIPLGGDFVRPEAAFVHDHLWARCVFLEDGDARLALVSCDLVGLPQDAFDEVLERLRSPLGLADHELVINCTHTHSGPDTPAIIHEPLDHPYMDELPALIAKCVEESATKLEPACAGYAAGSLEGVCMNRRVRVRGGRVRMNWESIPVDDIVGYGPIDPLLGVLRIDAANGTRISTLVHYACHSAIVSPFPQQISGDYPGLVCRTIERLWGGTAVFLNGACGDINHIMRPGDYAALNTAAQSLPFEEVERVGQPIAAKALELLPTIRTADAAIASASKRVLVPLRKPPFATAEEADSEAARQQARMEEAKSRGDDAGAWSAMVDMTYAQHGAKLLRANQSEALMRFGAFRIGDLAVACVPCETFVEIGLAIKASSPFPATWVTGITSAYTGYLPTEEAFSQGGYEIRTCGWSKWAENADKTVTEESVGLLQEL